MLTTHHLPLLKWQLSFWREVELILELMVANYLSTVTCELAWALEEFIQAKDWLLNEESSLKEEGN